jgi:hypothetical protein
MQCILNVIMMARVSYPRSREPKFSEKKQEIESWDYGD